MSKCSGFLVQDNLNTMNYLPITYRIWAPAGFRRLSLDVLNSGHRLTFSAQRVVEYLIFSICNL